MKTSITLEELENYKFTNEEVLKNDDQISKRKSLLKRALDLSVMYGRFVELEFKNKVKVKHRLKTRVLAITQYYIVLKGCFLVPIRSISEVKI